jgi:hypothetical protein
VSDDGRPFLGIIIVTVDRLDEDWLRIGVTRTADEKVLGCVDVKAEQPPEVLRFAVEETVETVRRELARVVQAHQAGG